MDSSFGGTGLARQWVISGHPIPAGLETAGEALVSLSLAVEGCVALNLLPTRILFPCITLHGYLLGAAITGAEPTPLIAYFTGLAIAQTSMLVVVSLISNGSSR